MRFPLAIEDRNSFVRVGSPADDRCSECPASIERDDSCSVYEECPAYIERDDSCPVYEECTAYAEKEHSAPAYTPDGRVSNDGSCLERNLNARRSKKGSRPRRIFTAMLSQIKGWACCGSAAGYEIPEVTSGEGRRGALLKY
ncbi:hypothetical protein B0H13DRAFT_1852550 [Mycena leptocephala]|nr:hypothetical protein B0H13DRAFT_1852550 [Mycena leptocephala]